MHNIREEIKREKAMLCAVNENETAAMESLNELAELAKSAGAEVAAKVLQLRDRPTASAYVGAGKLQEIKDFCESGEIDLLIFDDELSPTQQRNIENATGVRTIDRTALILDIFAQAARSREGRVQVELAQLSYLLPRLSGTGTALSRLGGGIGTRGPGETKLESDRRHIRRRIHALKAQLRQLERHRGELRRRRQKNGIPTAAIVGYTNAGKSTLMNALTKAGVLAMDRLFATLDPTARKLTLPDGRDILLIDTVGFIRKLPHHLIESFHSTLEEAALADLIIHVCDASSPYAYEQITVTDELLERLGCAGKPVITVLNKCDKSADMGMLPAKENSVLMSAKTGDGTDALLAAIMRALPNIRTEAALLIPYDDGEFAAEVRKTGEVKKEAYLENGLFMKVRIDRKTLAEAEKYLCDEDIL